MNCLNQKYIQWQCICTVHLPIWNMNLFNFDTICSSVFVPSMHPCRILYVLQYIYHVRFIFCVRFHFIRVPFEHTPRRYYYWNLNALSCPFCMFHFRAVCSAIPIHNTNTQCAHRSNWIFYVCNLNDIFLIKAMWCELNENVGGFLLLSFALMSFMRSEKACVCECVGCLQFCSSCVRSFHGGTFFRWWRRCFPVWMNNRVVFLWLHFPFNVLFDLPRAPSSITLFSIIVLVFSLSRFSLSISPPFFPYPMSPSFVFVQCRQFLLNFDYTHHSFILFLLLMLYYIQLVATFAILNANIAYTYYCGALHQFEK